jgi:hypothetical protein
MMNRNLALALIGLAIVVGMVIERFVLAGT